MRQWLIAVLVLILALTGIFTLFITREWRPKGHLAGGAMMIAFIFASIFDPARAAAIVQVDKRKELGDTEDGEGGEGLD